MEALECIKTRRSVRKFTEQPVTEDEVRQVVEAAAFAPSWKNTQIARYIVVTDKEKKDKLADNCMLGFAYNQKTPHGGGKKEGQPAVFLPLWTPAFPLLPNLAQISYM